MATQNLGRVVGYSILTGAGAPGGGLGGNGDSYINTTNGDALSGQIKVWNGTSFVAKPVKVWDGTIWAIKPLKRWTGTDWLTTPY